MARPTSRRRISVTLAVGLALATAAVVTPLSEGLDRAAADAAPTGQLLPVAGVTASGTDGTNGPGNAVDNNLSTRWSGPGDGAWIRLDLGSPATVQSIQIAWYHGDERIATFDVQTSTDASTWRTVHSGQSSGTTTGYETYDVTDSTGRYVRVVGHGNTVNDWTSITEIRVYGDGTGYDPNGVRQLHPTNTSTSKAKPWVLGYTDADGLSWWDRAVRLNGKWLDDDNVDLTISGSGKNTVVNAKGSQIRLYVAATRFDPNNHCDGDNNTSQVRADGYMCSSKDWRNVEITGYYQLVTASSSSSHRSWQMYGGGGRHTDDSAHRCKGTAYKAQIDYEDGLVRLRKEAPHPYYHNRSFDGRKAPNYMSDKSRWLGMKLVRYETTVNGRTVVRLKLYLDTSGIDGNGNPYNNWTLVASTDDAGGWGDDLDLCGVASDQIMRWGGPWAAYRWDDTNSNVRLMSIREIVPPTS